MKQSKARESKAHSEMAQKLTDLSRKDCVSFKALVDQLSDKRLSMILFLRHGYGCSWDCVDAELKSQGMYYSLRHIFRLYAKALDQAEQILKRSGAES